MPSYKSPGRRWPCCGVCWPIRAHLENCEWQRQRSTQLPMRERNSSVERNQLEAILRDEGSTQAEKAAAQEALAETAPDTPLGPQAVSMLRALGKERMEDLYHTDIEKHIARNGVKPSNDPVVLEFGNWVAPDDRLLCLIVGTTDVVAARRWNWQHTLETCGDRPDVKRHARARLAEL